MYITENQLNIKKILNVKKGRIAPNHIKCTNRHSDCFVYVLSGDAEYTFSGHTHTVKSGNLFFLAKGSNYTIKVTNHNYTYYYTDFLFEKENGKIFQNMVYNTKSIELLKSDFEKLYHLWNLGNYADKLFCYSLLYKIYSEIAKSAFAEYLSHERRDQIEKIVEYIYQNLSNPSLDVPRLSRMCSVSEVHFRRIFNSVYHTSPIKFITALRIEMAKELLTNEVMPISKISELCGFQSHYYFSKVFKSATSLTPTQFRTKYKFLLQT